MRLNTFNNDWFEPGAAKWVVVFWYVIGSTVFESWLPGSFWRCALLKVFGARIGRGVIVKPHVRVKYPWRLVVGDHTWIGEGVWIDNLAQVRIGSHVCVSQGVYLCTGSHDWRRTTFDLIVRPIVIGSHAWLCAMSRVGPGVVIGEGSVLAFAAVATRELEPWSIFVAPSAMKTSDRLTDEIISSNV